MNNEIDKIGDLFRNTLKDHHMDSDAHLWERLETQLSAQASASLPHTSMIRNLTWVKVSVAASVIISAALAFNYIYLPLKNAKPVLEVKNTSEKNAQAIVSIIDSTSVKNELQNQQINQLESNDNLSRNSNKTESIQKQHNKPLIDISDQKNTTSNNNSSSNLVSNTQQNLQQNTPVTNTQPNPLNNKLNNQNIISNTAIVKKDSIRQQLNNNNYTYNSEPLQNIVQTQDNTVKNDIIKDSDIPNIFTPNYDGSNDYFVIRNIEKSNSNQLVIKNRNGNTIYEKINYQNDWDASNVPEGVYFFFLKYNANGNNFGKYGSITIKR
jgi:gliding motility-associated-like protein